MMDDAHRTDTEARAQLLDRLGQVRAGMLGIDGGGHMRPMSHHLDEAAGELLFLTSRRSALATEVGQGATGHYCLVTDGFYACIMGTLSSSGDASRVDDMWSPATAAWFTGRDDPDILLLTMPMREAEVWTSTDSSLHYGFEIARANLNPEYLPHVGTHDVIRF
jgi:general stress protein 26